MYIYTDGACSGNPGVGGWGFCYSISDKIVKRKGAEKITTNNRMELQAIIKALDEYIDNFPDNSILIIVSDSAYAVNGATTWMYNWKKNGWRNAKGDKVKNSEMWDEIMWRVSYLKIHKNVDVKFQKVAGHKGDLMNEIADKLAVSAREEMERMMCEQNGFNAFV